MSHHTQRHDHMHEHTYTGDEESGPMKDGVRSWLLLGLAGTLALAGCKGKAGDAAAETARAQPAATVLGRENVAVVASDTLRSGPTLAGTLAPERKAEVRAEVGGTVLEVKVEAGQPVAKGAVLGRLDDTAVRDAYLSARAAVRTAETQAQLAHRNDERTRRLGQAGAVADRDVEQAQLAVTNAEGALADARARLASAQKQLDKTTLQAPFAGIVSERAVSVGDVVQPGGLLFTVMDPASMQLEATVPADQLAALRVGTPVSFGVTGYAERTFTGRVTRINPAADPATRQVRIIAAIPNAGRSLVAGLFAQGRVATETKTAPSVPVSAVDQRGLEPTVLRLKNAKVERVPVTLGLRDQQAERVEITRGLAVGDTVLLGSAQGISEGTVVRLRQDEVGEK